MPYRSEKDRCNSNIRYYLGLIKEAERLHRKADRMKKSADVQIQRWLARLAEKRLDSGHKRRK